MEKFRKTISYTHTHRHKRGYMFRNLKWLWKKLYLNVASIIKIVFFAMLLFLASIEQREVPIASSLATKTAIRNVVNKNDTY